MTDHTVPAASFIDEMLDSRKPLFKQIRCFASWVQADAEGMTAAETHLESAQRDVLAHGGPRDGLKKGKRSDRLAFGNTRVACERRSRIARMAWLRFLANHRIDICFP